MADCLCTRYARATEWAALAGARWLGRADEEAAEDAAASGMKSALDEMPIEGEVVIGARTGETLLPGGTVGAGGERVDREQWTGTDVGREASRTERSRDRDRESGRCLSCAGTRWWGGG